MSRFTINDLALPGLKCVTRKRLGDERGFLSRLFCFEGLSEAGWKKTVVQINHSFTSKKGSIRGMHYQNPPHSEMKLVSCIRGEVFDVAIDLRSNSSTFLHWHAECLSSNNNKALLIPEGFAHGFQTLSDDCELIYLHTEAYAPDSECGISYADPEIAIGWPLPVADISDRDKSHPLVTGEFRGIDLL